MYTTHTDDRYTVQWDEVHNHDHVDAGPFTFQVSLFPNGTIHFVYRNVSKEKILTTCTTFKSTSLLTVCILHIPSPHHFFLPDTIAYQSN